MILHTSSYFVCRKYTKSETHFLMEPRLVYFMPLTYYYARCVPLWEFHLACYFLGSTGRVYYTSVVRLYGPDSSDCESFRSRLANRPPKKDGCWASPLAPPGIVAPVCIGWTCPGCLMPWLIELADVDWKEIDIPLSSEPTLPRRCGFSPATVKKER